MHYTRTLELSWRNTRRGTPGASEKPQFDNVSICVTGCDIRGCDQFGNTSGICLVATESRVRGLTNLRSTFQYLSAHKACHICSDRAYWDHETGRLSVGLRPEAAVSASTGHCDSVGVIGSGACGNQTALSVEREQGGCPGTR
jgi:hypothetical protein